MAEVKAVKIKACGSPKSSERCERTGVVEQLAAKRVLWIWPGGCAEPVGTARPVLLSTARRAAQHTRLPLTRWSSAVSRNLKHFLRRRRSKSTWKWDRGACFVMGPAFSSLPQPVRRWCIRYAKHKHSALLLYRRFTSRGTADVVAPLVASWMENPGIWTLLFFFAASTVSLLGAYRGRQRGSLLSQTAGPLLQVADCYTEAEAAIGIEVYICIYIEHEEALPFVWPSSYLSLCFFWRTLVEMQYRVSPCKVSLHGETMNNNDSIVYR